MKTPEEIAEEFVNVRMKFRYKGEYQKELTAAIREYGQQERMKGLLGEDHKSMKVSGPGVLKRLAKDCSDRGLQWVAGEMLGHLEESAERFYAGDPTGVDEFFQLYDWAKDRKKE